MSKKQLINAFIDLETYIALKSQEVNVSELVRNALRAAVDSEIPEDEEFLLDQVKKDRDEIRKASKRLAQNSMKLSVLQDKRIKKEKENDIKIDAYEQSLKEARVLDF